MSEQDKKSGEPKRAAASEAEQPQADEDSTFDMKRHMTRMMEHCACGPGMMGKMAGMMGGHSPKTSQHASKDQD